MHKLFQLPLVVCLSTLLAFSSCTDTIECMDINTGDHPLLDSSVSSFAYAGDETLFFRDSAGNELQFVIRTTFIDTLFATWTETTLFVEEGECAEEMTVTSNLGILHVQILSQPLIYYINYNHVVSSILNETEPVYYDEIRFSISTTTVLPDSWGISIRFLLDARGNEAFLNSIPFTGEYADQLALDGKSFNNVYFNQDPDGSAVYYNQDQGLIGFRERQDVLWVLDR